MARSTAPPSEHLILLKRRPLPLVEFGKAGQVIGHASVGECGGWKVERADRPPRDAANFAQPSSFVRQWWMARIARRGVEIVRVERQVV